MSKKLNQMIREELTNLKQEGGSMGHYEAPASEPLDSMLSSNKPVSSYTRQELSQALKEVPEIEKKLQLGRGNLPPWTGQWIEDVKSRAAEMGLMSEKLNQMIREELGKLMEQGSDAAAGTGFNVIRKLPPSAPDPDPSITAPSGEPTHPEGFPVAGEEVFAYPEPEETETKRFGTTTLGGGATGGGYKSRFEEGLNESQDPFKRISELALKSYGTCKYED